MGETAEPDDCHRCDAATGQQIWRDDTDRVVSPPTVSGNTLYCGSAYGCIALDAATGKDKWGFKAGNCVEYPPTLSGGTI